MTRFQKKELDALDAYQHEMNQYGLCVNKNSFGGCFNSDGTAFSLEMKTNVLPVKGNKDLIEKLDAAGYTVWKLCRKDENGHRYFVFIACKTATIQLDDQDSEEWTGEGPEQSEGVEAWGTMTDAEQTEIVTKAAKNAAYQAGAYGVFITFEEIVGSTWLGVVDRLYSEKLNKENEQRATGGKSPLTITQIAYRAAHTAAELWRYNFHKNNALPLATWGAVDDGGMEARIIDRLVVEGFAAGRDATDKLIIEMLPQGYTTRQIGAPAGMSGPAVHKRIRKIRNALKEVIA